MQRGRDNGSSQPSLQTLTRNMNSWRTAGCLATRGSFLHLRETALSRYFYFLSFVCVLKICSLQELYYSYMRVYFMGIRWCVKGYINPHGSQGRLSVNKSSNHAKVKAPPWSKQRWRLLGTACRLRRYQLGHLLNVYDRDGERVRGPCRWGAVDGSERSGSVPYEHEEERRTKGNRSPLPRRKLEREASLGKRESGSGQKIWASDGDTLS